MIKQDIEIAISYFQTKSVKLHMNTTQPEKQPKSQAHITFVEK